MQNGINYWRQTWLQGPEPFSQLESGCANKHPKSISRSVTPTAFSIRLLFFCERKRSVMLWKGQADESFDRFWILSSPKLTEQTAKRVDAKGHGPLKHSESITPNRTKTECDALKRNHQLKTTNKWWYQAHSRRVHMLSELLQLLDPANMLGLWN